MKKPKIYFYGVINLRNSRIFWADPGGKFFIVPLPHRQFSEQLINIMYIKKSCTHMLMFNVVIQRKMSQINQATACQLDFVSSLPSSVDKKKTL